ncbi:hypothetical protein LK10_06980 [Sinomonas humi]|uniref:Uncharacterized protein n=1 Tax=Sinomonas humi TaxID=1338436 RepID=A0A0B2AKF6_9MICC|nr:hypothetical protein LK10_06980 [Sinomonas humi]
MLIGRVGLRPVEVDVTRGESVLKSVQDLWCRFTRQSNSQSLVDLSRQCHCLEGFVECSKDLSSMRQQSLPMRCEFDRPTSTGEQLNPEFVFEVGDAFRQGRSAHVQAARSPPEVKLFRDHCEVTEVANIHMSTVPSRNQLVQYW